MEQWASSAFPADAGITSAHTGARGLLASEPREVSLLFWLQFVRGAGGMGPLGDTAGGAQQDKIVGGAGRIAQSLHALLGAERVCLNAAVASVTQPADGDSGGVCCVRLHDGRTLHARRIVFAAAPALASRVVFEPPLPAPRDALQQRMALGGVIKCFAVYSEPFWRQRGLSGLSVTDADDVQLTYDASSPQHGRYALVAFVLGRAAREWSARPAADRRLMVLRALRRLTACDAALQPLQYFDMDWCAEQWSRGGYLSTCGPGVLSLYGSALRAACGRVHWAGTETATRWAGYIEGALQAGDRAAREVIAELDPRARL